MIKLTRLIGLIGAVAALGACGGGNDAAAPPPPVVPTMVGLYSGMANSVSGVTRSFEVLLLANGRAYGVLIPASGTGSVFFGGGNYTASGFNSVEGGNLRLNTANAPLSAAALTLAGPPRGTLTGTLTGSALAGEYQADLSALSYDATFDRAPAPLADVAGSYTGNSAGTGNGSGLVPIVVQASGNFTGTSRNGTCPHSGTLTPSSAGNYYTMTLTFGAGCSNPSVPLNGIALWKPASATAPAVLRLFVSASNSTTTFAEGYFYVGS